MCSSAFDPDRAADAPQPDAGKSPAPADQDLDGALLERVLQQTAALSDSDEPLGDADREAFLDAARRFRGQPFGLPVTVELVRAVLSTQFPVRSNASGIHEAIAARVAQSLYDDPPSHDRLEAFWVGISGERE